MAETAEFSANVLSASKRLQILQNGSMLKFNEKARNFFVNHFTVAYITP